MPTFEGKILREPDGQYTWIYYKDGAFQEVGGANIAGLNAAVNAVRDKIAQEPNIGNAKEVGLIAVIP